MIYLEYKVRNVIINISLLPERANKINEQIQTTQSNDTKTYAESAQIKIDIVVIIKNSDKKHCTFNNRMIKCTRIWTNIIKQYCGNFLTKAEFELKLTLSQVDNWSEWSTNGFQKKLSFEELTRHQIFVSVQIVTISVTVLIYSWHVV